jgi:IS5 family transposase
MFAYRSRAGRAVTDTDLFGTTAELVGAGVSSARRPRLPIRLKVALLILKHAYNESDESVTQR